MIIDSSLRHLHLFHFKIEKQNGAPIDAYEHSFEFMQIKYIESRVSTADASFVLLIMKFLLNNINKFGI